MWTCFHCSEEFDAAGALLHFGASYHVQPACQIDVGWLRELESELARYREEDTDLHRQIARMESEHQQALRDAEEKGYSLGLLAGRA